MSEYKANLDELDRHIAAQANIADKALRNPRINMLEDRLVPHNLHEDDVWATTTKEHEKELQYLDEALVASIRRKELMHI